MRTEALAPATTAGTSDPIVVTGTPVTLRLEPIGIGLSPFTKFPVFINGQRLVTTENGRRRKVSLRKGEPQIGLYLPGSYTVERPELDGTPVGIASLDDAAETIFAVRIRNADDDIVDVVRFEQDLEEATTASFKFDAPDATVPLASFVWTPIGDDIEGNGDLAFALEAGQTYVELIGTPDTAGTFYGKLDITDDEGAHAIRYLQIIVAEPVSLLVGTVAIPANAYRGVAYASPEITIENGTAPYVFTNTGDALPAGLALDADTGEITGTPTTAGAATAGELTVTDALGRTATIDYSIDVDALTVTESYPDGTEEEAYDSSAISASGGLSPYVTYAVTAGSFPPTFTLETNGRIHGTPDPGDAGTYAFTITATDGRGMTGTVAVSIDIAAA